MAQLRTNSIDELTTVLCSAPAVANRVRELVLLPSSRPKYDPYTQPSSIRTYSRISRFFSNLTSHKKTFLSFAEKLTSVVSLDVQFIDNYNLDIFTWRSLITHTILQRSSKEIRTLKLAVPLEHISDFLPPPSFHLPQLENLTIRLLSVWSSRDIAGAPIPSTSLEDTLTTVVFPFVRRQASTLCTLDFDTPSYIWKLRYSDAISTLKVDVGLLLKDMPRIPSLTSLSISVSQYTSMVDIRNFLDRNVSTLRELTVAFIPRWVDSAPPLIPHLLLPLQIPNLQLEKLTIKFEGHPALTTEQTGVLMSLIRCQPLVSLQILGNVQSPQAAACFFNPVSGCIGQGSKLRTLQIRLQELTPLTLDAFATCLTNLRDLVLITRCWRRRPTDADGDTLRVVFGGEYEFALEMSRRSYPHWNLQYLSISSGSWAPGTAKRSKYCLVAVAMAIPSLKSLNGVGRTEFITGAQEYVVKNTDEHLPWY